MTQEKCDVFLRRLKERAYSDLESLSNIQPDLTGWMCHGFESVFTDILQSRYHKVKRPLTVIEVGTWKGLSAATMARISKHLNIPIRIICIDTWLGAPEFWTWGLDDPTRGGSLLCKNGYPQVYYTFLRNVVEQGHTDVMVPLPVSSNEAVDVLRFHEVRADLIYVDAAHEYEAVKNDIERYWSLLEDDGVMFGDDYVGSWPGVVKAVNEFSQSRLVPFGTQDVVWYMKK